MSRRLKRWLIVLAVLLVVGIAFVWTLPEIVKWQALKQIPAITGRAAAIEDIDINLFTGRVAIKKFRLAEPDPAQAFVEFERLDVRVVPWSGIFGHIRVAELVLTAPTVNLVRVSSTVFNFSDILARLATSAGPPPPTPAEPKPKSRWTVGVDRFALIRANLTATDRAVKPVSEWKVRDLSIEAGNLTTKPSGPVGKLAVHGALNNSPIEFSAQDIDLTPTSFGGKFSIQNFSLLQVGPYLPPTLPASLESGIAGITMTLKLELGQGGLAVGLVTGDLTLTSLVLAQPGKTTPFLTVPRIAVGLKEVNLVSRVVTVSSVDIEGLDLKAVRDKQEQIDLLELMKKPDEAATGASSSNALGSPSAAPRKATKPEPEYKITVEKIALKGGATFTDEAISTPATVLKLGNLAVQVDDVTWPNIRPMNLALTMSLPGGGKVSAKGAVKIEPLDLTLTLNTRDAPIEPYRAYFPFPASFSGRFNSDSQNRIRVVNGKFSALSRGNSWATDLAVKAPDGKEAPLRLERMEINGIDFGWPTHARVARVLLKKPVAELDRAADGSINVQKLFTPTPKEGAAASPTAPAPAKAPAKAPEPGPKPPGLLETMELHFKEIVVEDGYVRFLDHSTQPPFSEDITKLTVTVKDLSNKASQRANLLVQAIIGGDAALDIRGDMSAIGAPTYVDMVGELKKFTLAAANPYMDSLLAWTIRRGELTAKLEYKIEQGKLDAKNDILVGNLRVAPTRASDEVKKRIGLPLGLIVSLIKDGSGNIHVNVPITGTLTDRQFDFSDAIWSAVKNVLVNVLKAPFRAIGGLFTSGDDKIDEIKVDPVVFAAGGAVLSPELERQTVRVGDFLRRAPYVGLTLSSVTSPADVEVLKERAVAARVDKFRQEQGIADLPTALRRYYQVVVKDAQLPMSVEEQLVLLRKREPVPAGPLAELRQRRLDVTRERLAKVEGIPEARLQVLAESAPAAAAPTPPPASAAPAPAPESPSAGGRVEFGITGESD
ncbi:MAG TPA: DUF748 domain-containing protein [Candidatus Acidoferrum sp.]|nr:DUF748 domain-containing protein [Candidatus Acidoferrum sp.]